MSDTPSQHQPTASIQGQVSSSSGARLSGASITCNDLVTTTLADGTYRFMNLAPSTYVLSVSLKGYQSATETRTITNATTHTVDFHLSLATGTASITGQVIDTASRHPVTTGTVILILPISNQYSTITIDGYYTFSELPAGTYQLITSIPEYNDCHHTVVLAKGESKIQNISCTQNREVEPAWG